MEELVDFDFRNARSDDIDKLISFWLSNSETSNRPMDTHELVRQLIDRDPEALILATNGERIMGTVIAGWDGWRGSIYRLAVDSSIRRAGLGAQLMKLAEGRLKSLGAPRVGATVLESNE